MKYFERLSAKHSVLREPLVPWYVVLHDTEGYMPGTLTWLATTPSPPATCSVHYLVTKKGEVFQIGKDYWHMWHAGRTYWADRAPGIKADWSGNYDMIGIELEHVTADQGKTYPKPQLTALDQLIDHLFANHGTLKGVLGHKDIAYPRGRKVDPQLNPKDYGIQAVRARLEGEDEMTPEQDRLLRELKVSAVAQSFFPALVGAMLDGDLGLVSAVKADQAAAVKSKRKELGLDK